MKKFHKYSNELDGEGNDLGGGEEFSLDSAIERVQEDTGESIIEDSHDDLIENQSNLEGKEQEADDQAEESEHLEDAEVDHDAFIEELKESGQEKKAEQFGKLVESNRTLKGQLDEATVKSGHYDTLHNEIFNNAGLNVDTFSDLITVFEDVKNGNPTDESKAIASQFVLRMATSGFIDLDQLNPMQSHPDIMEKVNNFEIDQRDAMEIIRSREQSSLAEKAKEQQKQNESYHQELEGIKTQALNDINAESQSLSVKNADHKLIEAKIKTPLEEWAKKNPDPRGWPSQYRILYNIAKDSMIDASNSMKQNRNVNSLKSNGKSSVNDIPDLAEDGSNMIDRALAHMEIDGVG